MPKTFPVDQNDFVSSNGEALRSLFALSYLRGLEPAEREEVINIAIDQGLVTLTVWEVMIDDTCSTFSHSSSYGVFSSRENAEQYVKSLDWFRDWMYVQYIERNVNEGFGA